MEKKTIELSKESYENFEALKETMKGLVKDEKLTDEDVFDFMVREISAGLKMMQEEHGKSCGGDCENCECDHDHDHGDQPCSC